VRIDKFTWCVRLTKTRAIAAEFVAKGKVKLNGQAVKASKDVSEGDEISFQKHNAIFQYEVLSIPKSRLGAKLVADYLTDITTTEELDKFKVYQTNQSTYRQNGKGKPTTKDRRDLRKFMGED
jgi:ribosome-associated heat shock protein Hsp15